MERKVEIPYTICFCCYQQQVLMLYRTRPPNARLWNGLGGKIEVGETPLVSICREMREEAGINLRDATSLFFAGVTTWGVAGHDPEKGMYTFIAHLAPQQAEQVQTLPIPEGVIAWKSLAWVCDPRNQEVVSNIPHFLPLMLTAREPFEYFCTYARETSSVSAFRQLTVRPLPSYVVSRECQEY